MKNRFEVFMLPTNEASFPCICESLDINGKGKDDFELVDSLIRGAARYYHLYIVEPEATINVFDWYIDLSENKLIKSKFGKHHTQVVGYYLKVIASTDTSLGLPTIPNHFVKAYCLDKNTIIKNVEIVDGIANVNWLVDCPEKTEIVLDGIFPEDDSDIVVASIPNKPRVDFELLNQGIESISCFVRLSDDERANMLQFFERMKDPSFAQKACEWFQNH